jgi:multidrug efflux pump subunit AcrA (membrane-fusion protein)
MSQLTDLKRKRKIRRIIGFSLAGLVLAGALIFWLVREEEPPEVRTAGLSIGSIRSVMMLSAEIHPGSIVRQDAEQSQRIEKVHVRVGDQVKAGDVLLTLDRTELLEQYNEAVAAREEIEASIAESEAAAKAQQDAAQTQAAASEQAARDLEKQLGKLTASLSGALNQLVQVSSLQPVLIDVNPELSLLLSEQLSGFDPEAEDAQQQVQEAIDLLLQGISYSDNPDYQAALTQMQSDLQVVSSILPQVTGIITGGDLTAGLTSGLTSGLDISGQLASQLGSLGTSMETALKQAVKLEEQSKQRYDQSSEQLKASSDGFIAQINVEAGDYTGSAASADITSGLDLEALMGGGLTLDAAAVSGNSGAQSAIVIYDNTRPKAVFKASQFDVGRLQAGMPVSYDYNDKSYSGEVSFIAPYASSGSFNSGGSGLTADISGLSGLSSEPWLEVQLSILGKDLTDLIPGFFIDAEIETARAENVLLLPAEAMRRELDTYFVFVLKDDNTIARKSFIPGIQSDMTVEVIEGLDQNDTVILNPTSQLADGIKVKVNNNE